MPCLHSTNSFSFGDTCNDKISILPLLKPAMQNIKITGNSGVLKLKIFVPFPQKTSQKPKKWLPLPLLASSVLVIVICYCFLAHCDKLCFLHEQGVNFPLFLAIPSVIPSSLSSLHTTPHLDKMQREKDIYGDLNLITM